MNVKMKSLFVVAGLLLAGFVHGQGVQQGLTQLDGDQFGKAKTAFENAVAVSPTGENYYYLGYSQVRSKKLDLAKVSFEKGLAADPKNLLNKVGLASLLVANNNVAAAKVEFDKILADSKYKNAAVIQRVAEAYTMFYDTEKEDAYNKNSNDAGEAIRLIDLIPEKTKAPLTDEQLIIKGDAFLIKNDGGPAVTAYEQALNLNPNNAKARTKIGVVYLRGKNYTNALENYKEAISIDTNYAPGYKRLGEYFIIGGQYKNASRFFKKYLEKADATPELKLDMAKLLFLAKDFGNALKFTSEAEAAGIKDNEIYRMKGWSNIELGSPQLGIDNLEKLNKLDAKPFPTDNVYFGKGYQSLGNDSLALMYFQKAAATDTNNNVFSNIHDIVYKKKDYKAAIDASEKLIAFKTRKKETVQSNDYFLLSKDYFFYGQNLPKTDTIGIFNAGNSAVAALDNSIKINDKYAGFYLWKARASNLADFNGTNWSGVPAYEKFLVVADVNKTDKKSLLEANKYLWGYHLSITKDAGKALEYADKAIALNPDDAALKEYKASLAGPATPAAPATPVKVAPKKK